MTYFKRSPFIQLCVAAVSLVFLPLQTTFANQFNLPSGDNALIGDISYTSSASGDTVTNIAQHNNVGVNAILNANPGLKANERLTAGEYVKIPGKFMLPAITRRGIVINLPEMRMYYYPVGTGKVMTFPIGIGRIGKTVPLAMTAITRKVVNPTWTPPESIRQFNLEQGIELPASMGPGPDNPLGPYAIYLRIPTYLIHSTIFPESIGTRASFGCIRMHETDIKQFFPLVEKDTPVAIIDMPNKVAWSGRHLYMETHPPLIERSESANGVVDTIQLATQSRGVTMVNWQLVSYLTEQRDGIPHEIGFLAQ